MNDCIRILYLVDTLNDPFGDALSHLRRLTRNLDPKQFRLRVLAMGDAEPDAMRISLLCPVEAIDVKGTGPISMALARLSVHRKLISAPSDLVCAYGWAARVIGLPAAESVSPAVRLAVVRDMGFSLSPRMLCQLQRANEAASRFVTSSGAAASRLMRQEMIRRDRIDIIPDGIDWQQVTERTPVTVADAKHRFGFSIHQPVILMDAPFARPSDYSTFLKAAAFLMPHHPDARFVLFGRGDKSGVEGVTNEAGNLRLLDRVIFVCDQTLEQQWIHAADVGVVVSLLESYSDTLLKFMAAGLPVVATHAGASAEIIRHGETGYLVAPMEADALAMRIHILLVAQDLAAEFSVAARERVHDEFGVNREVQSFSDYYRTLALSAPGGWLQIA